MDLFNKEVDSSISLLPQDGIVNYYGSVFDNEAANQYYDELLAHIAWENDQAMMFGKLIITKRKVAWYGSQKFQYTYSKITKEALPWAPALLELKAHIEERSQESYNSCLLNLYHDGNEGMAWHSDGEKDLKKHGAIASVSFGAERKFAFKHKTTNQTVSLVLEHGSLLVMKDKTQDHWLHRLPPTKTIHMPRVNLTFRTIVR